MIITCIKCLKKFEVDPSLIPENGRSIQCGSCNHLWFHKPEIKNFLDQSTLDLSDEVNISKENNGENFIKTFKSFNLVKFLSFFLVFIISFIALIIVLDTFNPLISNIFPGLEIFLYNLFESLKDIYLFLKNLIV